MQEGTLCTFSDSHGPSIQVKKRNIPSPISVLIPSLGQRQGSHSLTCSSGNQSSQLPLKSRTSAGKKVSRPMCPWSCGQL